MTLEWTISLFLFDTKKTRLIKRHYEDRLVNVIYNPGMDFIFARNSSKFLFKGVGHVSYIR